MLVVMVRISRVQNGSWFEVEGNGRKKKKRGELLVGLGECSWPYEFEISLERRRDNQERCEGFRTVCTHQRRIGRPTNFNILKFGFRGDLPCAVLNVTRCPVALYLGRSTPSLGPGLTGVCAPASLSRVRCGVL